MMDSNQKAATNPQSPARDPRVLRAVAATKNKSMQPVLNKAVRAYSNKGA